MNQQNISTLLRDSELFRQAAFIGGAWDDAAETSVQVSNPATDQVIGHVPRFGSEKTLQAIDAAEKALQEWRDFTANERARILRRWYELMIAHQEDLAILMTVEQGKPLIESRGEIAYAASYLEWFA